MSEDNAKSNSGRNEDNWSELTQIGDIFISCGRENNQTILLLENRGQNEEGIEIGYQESQRPTTISLELFNQLLSNKPQRVQLPTRFEQWEKLRFVGIRKNTSLLVPIADLITTLNELRNEVKNQEKPEPLQGESELLNPKLEQSNDHGKPLSLPIFQETEERQSDGITALDNTLSEIKRKNQASEQPSPEPEQQKNSTSIHEKQLRQSAHEIHNKEKNTISNLENKITQLEQIVAERQKEIDSFRKQIAELTQKNSELKRQLKEETEAMSTDPEYVFREAAYRVLHTLFVQRENAVGETPQDPKQICDGIETEIKRFEAQFDGKMIYTLSVVKEYLTKVKGLIHFKLSELSSPENQPEQLAQLVLTGEPPDDVQFPYLGELGKIYWNDLKAFTTKLPQVIAETQILLHRIVIQLLDGFSPYRAKTAEEIQMSRCFYEEYLPNILQMMNLELVPIEIGQTEADSRIHDIQGSQRGTYPRGAVADIIQHGIRRISDKQIVKKPVVMRGEPE